MTVRLEFEHSVPSNKWSACMHKTIDIPPALAVGAYLVLKRGDEADYEYLHFYKVL